MPGLLVAVQGTPNQTRPQPAAGSRWHSTIDHEPLAEANPPSRLPLNAESERLAGAPVTWSTARRLTRYGRVAGFPGTRRRQGSPSTRPTQAHEASANDHDLPADGLPGP